MMSKFTGEGCTFHKYTVGLAEKCQNKILVIDIISEVNWEKFDHRHDFENYLLEFEETTR